MNLVDVVNKDHESANVKNLPKFRTGDELAVYATIKEGEKSRVQLFQGTCIDIKARNSIQGHFCIRKSSDGVGVERTFPFHSPNLEKVEVIQKGKSRKSKLYYLRERSGKGARISIDYDRVE